jgi:hypothetical protein
MEQDNINRSQAIAEEKANVPKGTIENVPSRSGVGRESSHPANPLDDNYTKYRRAKYGETPIYPEVILGINRDQIADTNVNNTKTPNNPTRDEVIRQDNWGACPRTGYGRSMSQ